MSPSWQQVDELFAAALERPAAEREAFLESACGGDPSLRREVESLLASHGPARRFFADRPADVAAGLVLEADQALAGRRVGSYRLIREIGRGGMGVVYLAERADDQYRKEVAIKIVMGGRDTPAALLRFHTERQILANLDHPGIARLLDGGVTDDGLPYLVMEKVDGLSIDAYCEKRSFSIGQRLELFRGVCAAVHYAHQHLVVHGDIKPGNILVTPDGHPKLLDFGIARLLPSEPEPGSEPTATVMRMLTPEYASPEQIRGAPITTASDIYSLGVLLYRLLTGRHPYLFPTSQPLDVARVVCEVEPDRPSTASFAAKPTDRVAGLRRRLRGDLDTILLMSIRKEPDRRYASVEQFSEDIRRHLEGRPVIARKDTFAYRSGKFVRRHRVLVAAAIVLGLVLVGAVAGVARQARIASAERAKAERRFNEVRKLANSVMFQLHDQIADLPGSTEARGALVQMASEYLDQLAEEASTDPSLKRELVLAYQRVGDVRGNPTNPNLGDTAGALSSYRKALPIAEALVAADPADSEARRSLALVNQKMSDLQSWTGQRHEAVESARRALVLFEALGRADPGGAKARQALGVSHIKLGDILGHPDFPNVGDRTGALDQYRRSLTLWNDLVASDPTDATTRRYLGLIHERIGRMHEIQGDPAGAIESYRQSLTLRQALSTDYPGNTNARRDVAIAHEKVADVLAATDTTSALEHYRTALAIFEALSAADPKNANASRALAIEYEKLADVLVRTGDFTGALSYYRESLGIREALSSADRTNVHVRRDLAGSYEKLGDYYLHLASKAPPADGRSINWRRGRSWYQRSLDIWLDFRRDGTLQGPDVDVPEQLAQKIARCDAALAN